MTIFMDNESVTKFAMKGTCPFAMQHLPVNVIQLCFTIPGPILFRISTFSVEFMN